MRFVVTGEWNRNRLLQVIDERWDGDGASSS